jgi:ABC-type polysaccharide/polyol phosphate transport system ATPase subunit
MDSPPLHEDIAIRVLNLTKVYDTTLSEGYDMPSESPRISADGKKFKALDNITFDLHKGDVLGIIGKNGSGKSTLLKILSEVLPPTEGMVQIRGQVASLLDIGTGFHSDITGRENIYLNGTLLGMDKRTIEKKYADIVKFSGIGAFIDQPVKKYSSGMFLRLAFSVMVHLDNSILLLDEILSVGDADFRLKSYNKIKSLRGTDKTIVIVSHDLSSIVDLCNKCLILENGRLVNYGETAELVSGYMEEAVMTYLDNKQEDEKSEEKRQEEASTDTVREKKLRTIRSYNGSEAGNESIQVLNVSVSARGKQPNEPIQMTDEIEVKLSYQKYHEEQTVPAVLIASLTTGPVMALTPERPAIASEYKNDRGVGMFDAVCSIPASFLNAGIYSITLYFTRLDSEDTVLFHLDEVLHFKVNYVAYRVEGTSFVYKGGYRGPLYPLSKWTITKAPIT